MHAVSTFLSLFSPLVADLASGGCESPRGGHVTDHGPTQAAGGAGGGTPGGAYHVSHTGHLEVYGCACAGKCLLHLWNVQFFCCFDAAAEDTNCSLLLCLVSGSKLNSRIRNVWHACCSTLQTWLFQDWHPVFITACLASTFLKKLGHGALFAMCPVQAGPRGDVGGRASAAVPRQVSNKQSKSVASLCGHVVLINPCTLQPIHLSVSGL